ncbi:RNA-directed DNA polymerase, eukaryota, reverse transcriptase zinc-binding domain protein [Tanacetum coccineum]
MSNDDIVSGNKEDTSSIAAKIHDIKRQMLEGKFVLVGDDVIPFKPLNVDGQDLLWIIFHACLTRLVPLIQPPKWLLLVKEHFENFVYRFFLGKRVVYQMVKNYVKNVWSSFGLVRTMMNLKGIFFFKSSSNRGMESMLENGPWSIRIVQLILPRWSSLVNVSKEDLKSVSVQVKLHDVRITAFMKDELCSIAIKVGTPLILDTYTTSMCMDSWGRSRFAKAIIDQ